MHNVTLRLRDKAARFSGWAGVTAALLVLAAGVLMGANPDKPGPQEIANEAYTLVLTASPDVTQVAYGESVTFTATVRCNDPDGPDKVGITNTAGKGTSVSGVGSVSTTVTSIEHGENKIAVTASGPDNLSLSRSIDVIRVTVGAGSTDCVHKASAQIKIVEDESYSPAGYVWAAAGLDPSAGEGEVFSYIPSNSVLGIHTVKATSMDLERCHDETNAVVFKVAITGEDGPLLAVGNTAAYTVVVTPELSGTYAWSVTGGGLGIEGDNTDKSVMVTGLVGSASIDAECLKVVFSPPSASCMAETNLTVISVDIVDPDEDDVHLVGEEVKFVGELGPTGLSGVTYAWSVLEGTCDPSIATTEDFETTLKSEGTIKVKLEVTVGGTTCEKERTIDAVLPEVTTLSWNNDHAMTKWGGGAITDPVWVKALGGAVTKNEPGTYTKGGEATAELEIEGDSPLTHSTSVQVKGDGNTENFYPDGATFHNWTWSSGELQLYSSPLYASVNFYDTLDVTWYYRVAKLSGGWGDWVEMNESTHILYTVDATPAASPLYDRGVDKGCRYANGASDFAGAINTGLADDLRYEPTGCTSHDLGIFDIGSGQCCCHASVFSVLISHVTASSPATEDCWGGCSSSTHCHFKYSGWWGRGPTFQCQRPVEDTVDANPHFNFHVEVPYNGTVYDPSYGLTGWATLLETAPAVSNAHPNAAVFQSGSWPPATVHAVDWTCPH